MLNLWILTGILPVICVFFLNYLKSSQTEVHGVLTPPVDVDSVLVVVLLAALLGPLLWVLVAVRCLHED
jgi:phosphate/sulfate permease